jgi:hypothetical protein
MAYANGGRSFEQSRDSIQKYSMRQDDIQMIEDLRSFKF